MESSAAASADVQPQGDGGTGGERSALAAKGQELLRRFQLNRSASTLPSSAASSAAPTPTHSRSASLAAFSIPASPASSLASADQLAAEQPPAAAAVVVKAPTAADSVRSVSSTRSMPDLASVFGGDDGKQTPHAALGASPLHRYIDQISALKQSIVDARNECVRTADVNHALTAKVEALEQENATLRAAAAAAAAAASVSKKVADEEEEVDGWVVSASASADQDAVVAIAQERYEEELRQQRQQLADTTATLLRTQQEMLDKQEQHARELDQRNAETEELRGRLEQAREDSAAAEAAYERDVHRWQSAYDELQKQLLETQVTHEQELVSEVSQYETKLAAKTLQHDALLVEVDCLKMQLSDAKEAAENELKQSAADWEHKLDSLEKQLSAARSERDSLANQVTADVEKHTADDDRLAQAEQEAERAQTALKQEMQQREKQVEQLQAENERLVERAEQLTEKLTEAQTKLSLSDERASRIFETIAKKEDEKQAIQAQLDERVDALGKAQQEIQDLQVKVTQYDAELTSTMETLDRLLQEEANITMHRQRAEQLEAQVTKYKATVNELEIVLEDVTKERDGLQEKCRKFDQALTEIQRQRQHQQLQHQERQRTASAETEIAQLTQRVAVSDASLRNLQERSQQMSERFDATQKKWLDVQQELVLTRARCTQLEEERQAQQQHIDTLQSDVKQLRESQTESVGAAHERDELAARVARLQQALDEQRKLHAESVQASEARVAAWNAEREKLAHEIDQLRSTSEQYHADSVRYEMTLAEMEQEKAEKTQEVAELRAKLAEAEQQQQVALAERDHAQHEMAEIEQQWRHHCEALDEEVLSRDSKLQELQQQMEQLQETHSQELAAQMNQVTALQERETELSTQLTAEAQVVEEAQRLIVQYEDHVRTIQAQANAAEQERDALQKNLTTAQQQLQQVQQQLQERVEKEAASAQHIAHLHQQLNAHEQELQKVQQALAQAQQDARKRGQKGEIRQELRSLTGKMEHLQDTIVGLQQTRQEVEREREALQQALAHEKELSAQLQSAYDQDTPMLHECIRQLEQHVAALQAENDALRQSHVHEEIASPTDAHAQQQAEEQQQQERADDEFEAQLMGAAEVADDTHAQYFELLPIPAKFRKMIWEYRNQVLDLEGQLSSVQHQLLCVEAELAAERELVGKQWDEQQQQHHELRSALTSEGSLTSPRSAYQNEPEEGEEDDAASADESLNSVDDLQHALDEKLDVIIEQRHELNEELAEARGHLQTLVERYAHDLAEAKELIAQGDQERTQLEHALREAEAERGMLQQVRQASDERIAALAGEVAALQEQALVHKTSLVRMKASRKEAEQEWETQKLALAQRVATLQRSLAEVSQLRTQLEASQKSARELEHKAAEVEKSKDMQQVQLTSERDYCVQLVQYVDMLQMLLSDLCLNSEQEADQGVVAQVKEQDDTIARLRNEQQSMLNAAQSVEDIVGKGYYDVGYEIEAAVNEKGRLFGDAFVATKELYQALVQQLEQQHRSHDVSAETQNKYQARFRHLTTQYTVLKHKYNRQVRLRASLITQKRYLLQLVRNYQTTETQTWDIMAEMGFTKPKPSVQRTPRQKLRRCLIAVQCAVRLVKR
ncbi:hypothetical protein RI367_002613 [Sorochytrium milnesiophthora]